MKRKVALTATLILFLINVLTITSNVISVDESSDHLVGAAYMTFWGTEIDVDWHTNAVYLPTLGNYSSSNTTTANQHIKWALNHNIDFFFLDYGWATGSDKNKTETSAINGLLAAESMNRKDFNFSIFYFPDRVVDPGFVNKSRLEDDFSLMNKTYFSRSSYLRLDGRSVIILADFPTYLGVKNSAEEINNLFYSLKENYNLTLIPAFWPDHNYTEVLGDTRKVYDAITLWGTKTIVEYNEMISYSKYVNKTKDNFLIWSSIAENFDVAFVPLICPGYNNMIYFNMDKTRNPDTNETWWGIVTRNQTEFIEVCQLARNYSSPPHNMVLLFTWNDFKEGTSIEPTTNYDFTYLETVRDYIPEFPSFLILPVFMTGTLLLAVMIYKRKESR